MGRFAALLRGINVGGNNLIKMTDLAACFEGLGLTEVRTYIQSGNVIFATEETDRRRLTARIGVALSETFGYEASLTLRSADELKEIIAGAPEGFGESPADYRYDVIFLIEPLTASEAMQSITIKPGVDQAFAGNSVLYFSRLISKASQSRLPRIIGTPVYQSMTIRNWNTTTKLLRLATAEVR